MDANANTIPLMPPPLRFDKLLGPAVRCSSESQSEISSVDSEWNDKGTIAAQLGISNPDDMANERFKVDRQKLENLIKVDSIAEGKNGADFFFDNIMQTTSTFISWPCRLKIGAKTKKDPHVRIYGRPDDVMKAKDRVLAALDSRGSRVIMKMDISYTDHSYIIGRGGNNIKKIMEDTMTHIHFPDSNRSNPTEKSNQVSLCGSLEGVEKARASVRYSTPLIISFELPIMMPGHAVPDNDTQYVKDVESKCNIQVIFSSRSKLHSSLVLVKGSEREANKVQEATRLLIHYMCRSMANQISVNLQLEISPHHHDIVKGKNNAQLLSIMDRTKTKIIFPDVNDVNIKPIKKSQVTITGTIDGVYKARQQLIGNLPLALIFDYPETNLGPSDIENLSNKYGVYIAVRTKSRQSTSCVVIKGVEKFVDKIYEARHFILQLTTPVVQPDIPLTYFAPNQDTGLSYRRTLASMLSSYPESPLTPGVSNNFGLNSNNSPFAAYQSKFNNCASQLNQYQQQQQQQHQQQQQQQLSLELPRLQNLQISPNNMNRFHLPPNQNEKNYLAPNSMLTFPLPTTTAASSFSRGVSVSPIKGTNTSANTSGYESFSSSATSLEQLYAPYQQNMQANSSGLSAHFSPENQTFMQSNMSRRMNDSRSSFTFDNECRTPTPAFGLSKLRINDYDTKRMEGFRAMERIPHGEPRTPTQEWAGLGLSKTSPFALETSGISHWTHREDARPFKLNATTTTMDPLAQDRSELTQFTDIHSLLAYLKLEHYISNFVEHEVDLAMFVHLTDKDLVENLGISAFGARKRLLLAIKELTRPTSSIFSAAPGAERRPSAGW